MTSFMRLVLSIFLLVSLCSTFAQYNPGAKQISLSNSDVALSSDVFALFNNPSGLAQLDWREVGIYYSPAPFGFSELANGFIAYNEPFSFGSIAAGAMTYGFELYRETKLISAFSYEVWDNIFAGAAINYHLVSIQNYGNTSALYFNLGGLAYITNFLRWGFSVSNLNRAGFTDDSRLPVIMNTGFSYDVIDELTLNASVEKDLLYSASFQFGINYDVIKYFSIRTGFSNEPSRFSGGIGINYSIFRLDYAVFTHIDLGLTHQAGIIISFKE